MPSNHLTLCCPLFLPPSVFPSIRVFSSESVLCIRWLKYWSFSFSISPSNEYAGLISFRMDWVDLFAVQGTLKNHLQNHVSWIYVLKSLLISWWKGEINCTLLREEIQKPYIKQLYVKNGKKKRLFLERFVQRLQSQTWWWSQSQVPGISPSGRRVPPPDTKPQCWLHC